MTAPSKTQTCNFCKYAEVVDMPVAFHPKEPRQALLCRRYPPRPYKVDFVTYTDSSSSLAHKSASPEVAVNDWCGESRYNGGMPHVTG